MTNQSEAILENNLIKQLIGLGYHSVKAVYTDKEFDSIINHLAKDNVFQKAKTLRDRFSFK